MNKLFKGLSATALALCSMGASAAQLVVLDFTSGTDDVVNYTQSMRDDVQSLMETHYTDFDITFTQDLNPIGDASHIVFNSGNAGGLAEGIDFRNLNKNDNAVVNAGGILTTPSQSELVAASAVIGSHELGHIMGLRHADSMGTIGSGLPSTESPSTIAYAPSYPGQQLADETTDHIMASPASVGSSLDDLQTPSWFGERSAIKLSLIDQGSVQAETMGNTALVFDSPMVPNTLVAGDNLGQDFAVRTFVATGSISAGGQVDSFTFSGMSGELFTFELMSAALNRRISNTFDTTLELRDSAGNLVSYFGTDAMQDDEFETADSHIIDLALPGDDTYTLRVTPFGASDLGGYELFGQTFMAVDPIEENQPPTATPQSLMTSENMAIDFSLTGTDPEDDPLSFAITLQPANGSISGMNPELTYTPNLDFSGTDSFMFTVDDGTTTSSAATVSVVVTAVNAAPVADDLNLSIAEDGALAVTLSGTDPDADDLTFAVLVGPSNGTLGGTPPALTYTPTSNFFGSDSFTYTANDGVATSAAATVTIAVTPVNDAPLAIAQAVSVEQGSAVAIALTGADVDNDMLVFAVATGPANGAVTGEPPALTYTPAPSFSGNDSFTFTVSDGSLTSLPATIAISVGPTIENQVPVATPQSVVTSVAFPVSIVLAGTDADEEPITFDVASTPDNGTLAGTPPAVTYTGNPGFTGMDSFTFTVSDAVSTSEPATVSILVSDDLSDVACGRPTDLNRATDLGTFLWRDCTDLDRQWFLQVNGGGVSTNRTSSGSFQVIGGLQNLQRISIENVDTVDTVTDPNSTWFDLKVRKAGVDRLEFVAPLNTCFLPGAQGVDQITPAEPIFLGEDRVPLEGASFSLDTGLECQAAVDTDGDGLSDDEESDIGTNPLVRDTDGGGVDDGDEVANETDPLDPSDDLDLMGVECFAPTVDTSSEAGLFLWRACDGSNTWSMFVSAGGGGRVIYSGELTGGTPSNVTPIIINGNDQLELTPDGLRYRLIVRQAGRDLFEFTPAAGTCVVTQSPDVPVLLGESKTPARSAEVNLDNPAARCGPLEN